MSASPISGPDLPLTAIDTLQHNIRAALSMLGVEAIKNLAVHDVAKEIVKDVLSIEIPVGLPALAQEVRICRSFLAEVQVEGWYDFIDFAIKASKSIKKSILFGVKNSELFKSALKAYGVESERGLWKTFMVRIIENTRAQLHPTFNIDRHNDLIKPGGDFDALIIWVDNTSKDTSLWK
jgi:hypothetical protein